MTTSHVQSSRESATDASPAEYDRLAFAAYPRWCENHHDVYDALVHVFRNHVDARTRDLAGRAADEALVTPIVRRAFEIDFEARARSERQAGATAIH